MTVIQIIHVALIGNYYLFINFEIILFSVKIIVTKIFVKLIFFKISDLDLLIANVYLDMVIDLPKIQKGPDDFANRVRLIIVLAEDPVILRTETSKSVNVKATFMEKDVNWMVKLLL